MKEITIDIDESPGRKGIHDKLLEANPTEGDIIKLLGSKPFSAIQVFSLALFIFLFFVTYKEKRRKFGKEVIDKIFGKYDSEKELGEEIEQEYGVKVKFETKHDPEREDWMRMSAVEFERGYSDPDDDYSDVPVREPNPDYIPWKKGTS